MRNVMEWLKITDADRIIDSMQQDNFKGWYASEAEKEPDIDAIHREVYKDFIAMIHQKHPEKSVFNEEGFTCQTCVVTKADIIAHWNEQKIIPYSAYNLFEDKVPGCAYEHIPSEEILVYKIPDTCVDMFGIEKILADVLWEMTFYGISDEEVANARIQIEDDVEDSVEHIEMNENDEDVLKKVEDDSENEEIEVLLNKIDLLNSRFAYEMRLKIYDKVYNEIKNSCA